MKTRSASPSRTAENDAALTIYVDSADLKNAGGSHD